MSITSAIVDSREPDGIRALTFGGIPTATAPLEAGDLVATTSDDAMIVVARRAPNDLLNSMKNNLLFPVVRAMREQSPWAYLIVCGHISPGPDGKTFVNGVDTGWVWASVSGALLTVQELGVHVLQIPSEREYEQAVTRLGNRDRSPVIIQPQRKAKIFDDAELLLSALPNVGAARVQAILDHCGSAAYALEWLTDDECQNDAVPGVNAGIKRGIRRALGLDDQRTLAVVTKEWAAPPPLAPVQDEYAQQAVLV